MAQAPLPLSTIQALLFLCMWPLPVERQQHDPSWLYSGIAVNAALYLGLHRPNTARNPQQQQHQLEGGDALEKTMTWLGCVYISGSYVLLYTLQPFLIFFTAEPLC